MALAALALDLVAPLHRDAPWRSSFAMGALDNVVPFARIFWAQTHIASGLASPLNATTPLFTVAVAHALTDDEKMTRAKVVARLAGVAVTIGPDLLARSTGDAWGQLACPGAARSYAFAGIYGWRFRATGIAPLDAAGSPVRRATY